MNTLTPHIRFVLDPQVPLHEAQDTLSLSLMAIESLFGADRVLLETATHFEPDGRVIALDVSTPVGQSLALVYGGFLRREFGSGAVRIDRNQADATSATEVSL